MSLPYIPMVIARMSQSVTIVSTRCRHQRLIIYRPPDLKSIFRHDTSVACPIRSLQLLVLNWEVLAARRAPIATDSFIAWSGLDRQINGFVVTSLLGVRLVYLELADIPDSAG